MNTISKKLRELEQNVLELPKDEDINLYIGDEGEHLLHTKAEKIKEGFRSDAGEIMFSNTLTFEEQTVKAQELLKGISEDEKFILDESANFAVGVMNCSWTTMNSNFLRAMTPLFMFSIWFKGFPPTT